ncbi:type I-C CRISPR-associated protein Cas8c/Csd1 [Paracoccus subflavus]|uniref:Type I-C CRISPR-associated protein Cas8c/Csd1 n=1 Tax=Paracoccus subflavus TaxID=2528244 RepID=A0A4Q9G3M4_9RHOB|nr:type I-C CRISPR-associated protein Cas8c/Csd1 [Paracoccus subflavus]TBN38298.1 type I-C CRISPR-associated protein Cas8c/Csd1 [Paracoccus subflavus]
MSLLAALVRAHDRLPDAPPFGYSSEKIGFCVVLNPDGSVAEVVDLRGDDKKRSPRMMLVPQAKKRTVGIDPNVLWDKTAYVLGITSGLSKRTSEEHAAFKAKHLDWLTDATDEGLAALRLFLEGWTPERFAAPIWHDDVRDQNLVFRLSSEFTFLHDRPAARELWRKIGAEGASDPQICLVTGDAAPVARLHPSIKGVWGAQSSGASLISFNLDAFTSYGHEQGDNAPVSEAAAFAYTTALNRYLADPNHRIQIGDASTIFWADCADQAAAEKADKWVAVMFGARTHAGDDEAIEEGKIRDKLLLMRDGKPLAQIAPELAQGVRFHVLGLAPNAARLSVRFWWENDFGTLAENYRRYLTDIAIEPPPRDGWPPLWRYLTELAVLGKRENVPPLVAGDWMRAIVTGTPYPLTLMSTALMRIRADGEVNALRAAILKSVLIRNFNSREAPVALDPTSKDIGYVLGRLFAAYENVQKTALGKNVNATIRDKFYGSASSTPSRVFGSLAANAFNHLSKIRKEKPAFAHYLQDEIEKIANLLDVSGEPFPASLPPTAQAKFALGYYHQASLRKTSAPQTESVSEVTE